MEDGREKRGLYRLANPHQKKNPRVVKLFPSMPVDGVALGWYCVLLGCCLRLPSLDTSRQLRVLSDASLSGDFPREHEGKRLTTLAQR